MSKLLTSGISFSNAANAEVVPKLLMLGIFLSILVILALQSVFLASLLVSGVFFCNSDLSLSYLVFKTNPLVSISFKMTLFYIWYFKLLLINSLRLITLSIPIFHLLQSDEFSLYHFFDYSLF